ncbi:MAG TPA: serine/threonine-protein kinase, partial [Clostridiales bacterium]|nr:serine/threonine-protein kinase [Clostridiales bacterium]
MDKYLGTYLDERYEILETIGTGGMAVVYKAMCHRLNRYVAVKILRDDLSADKEFRDRFQKESQAVAMLSHPNIVSVYDVSHSDNVEYIVMELIEGITLKQYMKKKGAFGWKEAMHFSVQIAKAMEHAHAKGIIHRDIKPQNIMILKDGTIKVADFGIAALESAHEKRSGQALGSVNYIAPEQAKGDVPDARSDIYSLGVVMYEMLTGELPYSGETENEIAMQHITGTPVPPSQKNREIPAELERITMRAMAQDIDERYQSATELLDDLEGFRKLQAAALAKSMQPEDVPIYESSIIPDVMPISRDGEIPRYKYLQRRPL